VTEHLPTAGAEFSLGGFFLMTRTVFFLLMLAMISIASSGCSQEAKEGSQKPEFRALWVTRFEWPDQDRTACQAKLREIFDKAADANFNAILFQVRGQCDTLYPSELEPWSPLIGSKDPGWDPLQFGIDLAHERGMELHAYINPVPVWAKRGSILVPERTTPEHVFYLHCQPDSKPNWAIMDEDGELKYAEYYWLSAGVLEVHEHARKVAVDLATRYDLDGIHVDRIRYPRGLDYNPYAKKRMEGAGNPDELPQDLWQRDQMNRLVKKMSAAVWAVKPNIKMTCAAWGIYDKTAIPGYGGFSSGIHDFSQDTIAWIDQGSMDALCPMIYWDIGGAAPDYDVLLKDFMKRNEGRRHIYGGMGAGRHSNRELQAEIEITREYGAHGNVQFAYGAMAKDDNTRFKHFKTSIYTEKVATPEMAWKKNPTEGTLIGHVKKGDKAVTDAIVKVEGVDGYSLSCADGFYAFLRLKPGKYSISAQKGGGKASATDVEIKAGATKTVELSM